MFSKVSTLLGGSKGSGGELSVNVVEARSLSNKDVLSKSDPYVELWIDEKYKNRTKTIDNSLNPVWNENLKFNIHNQRKRTLHIRVLDEDVATPDDTIGSAKVDLEEVFEKGRVDRWFKLPALFGLSSHGEVHLILEFTRT
ncbi:hypothetical protein G9A89_020674 [Geosiphon pyriformis]|nr:hypothetical protein G9A89_020674 [Geosiphon pyriformis]